MKSSPPNGRPAFTLLELVIVVCIIAILSVSLLVNFKGNVAKSRVDDQVVQIVHLLEEARSYSLTNFLVNDTEPASYYVVTITSAGMTLKAYVNATTTTTLQSVTMQTGYSITGISATERIFYFPPTGEICFDAAACTSTDTELTLTVSDSTGSYTQDIYFNKFGGAPEIVE